MKQYLDLLQKVLDDGMYQTNRTGVIAKRIDGAMLQFDLTEGFPAVTTKKLAFGAVKGELLGFIRGYDNAGAFRNLGCKVWDQNANENDAWLKNPHRRCTDDLGRIYGRQWRAWSKDTGCGRIDQLAKAINDIKNDPTSRRIIVTAWNPAELDQMALPPCHMTFQFLVNTSTQELSLCMYQRSCDMFLGIPFNIASYALLLELIAHVTDLKAKNLTMFLADVHIYGTHLEAVATQLRRIPHRLPKLLLNKRIKERCNGSIKQLEHCVPEDIELENYNPDAAIKAEMAV